MTPRKTLAIALSLSIAVAPVTAFAHDDHDHGHKDNHEAHPRKLVEKEVTGWVSDGSGYLGVRLQRVEGGLADALGLDEDSGVLVGQVMDDSPADDAGLKSGDIILRVEDEEVGTPSELRDAIRSHDAGDKVTIHVLRDGRERTYDVTLGESEGPFANRMFGRAMDGARRGMDRVRELRFTGTRGYLGVMPTDMGEGLADYFGAEDGGALVSDVVEDSPAEQLGLKAGDVITEVDGTAITNGADLRRTIAAYDEEDSEVEVVWIRNKRERRGTVTLEVKQTDRQFGLGDDGGPLEWHDLEGFPGIDVERFGHRAGDNRVMIREFVGEDGDLKQMIEELMEDVEALQNEVDDLKSE